MRMESLIRGKFLLVVIFAVSLVGCSTDMQSDNPVAPAITDGLSLDAGTGNGGAGGGGNGGGGDVEPTGGPVKVEDPPPQEP